MNAIEIRSGQFADDALLFSMYDQISQEAIVQTLIIFERNSGLKLNYDKSTVYRLGSLHNSNAKLYTSKELNWTNEKIKLLRIDIGTRQIVNTNYEGIHDKIKSILHLWKYRGLSLIGKITMIKALIGSLFVDKMNVIPLIPEKLIEDINDTLNQYIWKSAKPKVDLNILTNSKNQAGLKLYNLYNKDLLLKIQWIPVYFDDDEINTLANVIMKNQFGALI